MGKSVLKGYDFVDIIIIVVFILGVLALFNAIWNWCFPERSIHRALVGIIFDEGPKDETFARNANISSNVYGNNTEEENTFEQPASTQTPPKTTGGYGDALTDMLSATSGEEYNDDLTNGVYTQDNTSSSSSSSADFTLTGGAKRTSDTLFI